ncbi:MAG TPA: FCD domain-containing protein [Solirubrobacteraceae bacterium]
MQSVTGTNLSDEAARAALGAPLRATQLYERIVDRIAGEIRLGLLKPGERLPSERDLARRLEVGRSSVREAIAALQLQGVLDTRPGSGSFVAMDAVERVQELGGPGDGLALPHDASPSALLEARALLEPAVAALAARRGRADPYAEELLARMDRAAEGSAHAEWNEGDRLFHRQIAVMADNPVLVALADHIAATMDEPLWQRLRDESVAVAGRARLHAAEHRMIYEAIVAGDAETAAFYATQHIQRVRRYMTLD